MVAKGVNQRALRNGGSGVPLNGRREESRRLLSSHNRTVDGMGRNLKKVPDEEKHGKWLP